MHPAYSNGPAPITGPGNNDDELEAINVDGSGNIILSGYSKYIDGSGSHGVLSTVKYNASGTRLWAVQIRTGQIDNEARAIATDAAGNIYIAGTTIDTTAFAYDYLVLKLNASGVQQWVATYNGTAGQIDWARAIAVDATGNVYVTGQSMGELVRRNGPFGTLQIIQTGYDYVTIKYDPTGQTLWTERYYSSVGNTSDIPTGLVLDGADNVYVTGSANGASGQPSATIPAAPHCGPHKARSAKTIPPSPWMDRETSSLPASRPPIVRFSM